MYIVMGRRYRRGHGLKWTNRFKDTVDAAVKLIITRIHASHKKQ
jgi:hypothetical protein